MNSKEFSKGVISICTESSMTLSDILEVSKIASEHKNRGISIKDMFKFNSTKDDYKNSFDVKAYQYNKKLWHDEIENRDVKTFYYNSTEVETFVSIDTFDPRTVIEIQKYGTNETRYIPISVLTRNNFTDGKNMYTYKFIVKPCEAYMVKCGKKDIKKWYELRYSEGE